MNRIVNAPILVFLFSLVVLWLFEHVGAFFGRRLPALEAHESRDFGVVLAASLTLLGLLIGFSFSMATSRYDQRKNYEAEEANVIGTEYVRADLLPPADAARVRELLRKYLDQRVLFYQTRDEHQLRQIATYRAQLQSELWSVVQAAAAAKPTPTVALAVSGMNDVLNAQAYTQAAWWNRIPRAGWALMATIAICCHLLLGYTAHETRKVVLVVLPLAVSISFFLIADIDSPRGGVIHVVPQNLVSLSRALNAH